MTIYILLLLEILVFRYIFKLKKSKVALLVILLELFILSSCRGYLVGLDTISYIDLYNGLSLNNFDILSERYESGFLYLIYILRYITTNPRILLIISSLLLYSALYIFITNNSKDYLVASYMYITMCLFASSMNIMRQFMAISLVMLGTYFLMKRSYIWSFILYISSVFFHKLSIIPILCIIFANIYSKKKKSLYSFYLLGIPMTIIWSVFSDKIFNYIFQKLSLYSYYQNSTYMNGEGNLGSLINLLLTIFLLFIYIYANKQNKIKYYNFYLILLWLSVFIGMVSFNFSLLSRIVYYFSMFSLIAIPNSLANMEKSYEKMLLTIVFILGLTTYFLVISIYRPEWTGVIPYFFFNYQL